MLNTTLPQLKLKVNKLTMMTLYKMLTHLFFSLKVNLKMPILAVFKRFKKYIQHKRKNSGHGLKMNVFSLIQSKLSTEV